MCHLFHMQAATGGNPFYCIRCRTSCFYNYYCHYPNVSLYLFTTQHIQLLEGHFLKIYSPHDCMIVGQAHSFHIFSNSNSFLPSYEKLLMQYVLFQDVFLFHMTY